MKVQFVMKCTAACRPLLKASLASDESLLRSRGGDLWGARTLCMWIGAELTGVLHAVRECE